jgi:hypothetical protein
LQLLDLIVANPFITPRGAEKRIRLSYNTIVRAIQQLEQSKILSLANEAKRGRVYCANAVLEILEEPARLRPA